MSVVFHLPSKEPLRFPVHRLGSLRQLPYSEFPRNGRNQDRKGAEASAMKIISLCVTFELQPVPMNRPILKGLQGQALNGVNLRA
jgi:hypothetical protein